MALPSGFQHHRGQGGWSWRQIRLEVEVSGKRAEKMEVVRGARENAEGGAGDMAGAGNPALPLSHLGRRHHSQRE